MVIYVSYSAEGFNPTPVGVLSYQLQLVTDKSNPLMGAPPHKRKIPSQNWSFETINLHSDQKVHGFFQT